MDSAARIELYVPERAVARSETAFQQWVETVTAPLRYVCVVKDAVTRFCTTPLGAHIKDFGDDDQAAPRRQGMSVFSGFSMARDQRGVWFREGTAAPEEDRVTIYTFLVAGELGEVAYYAIRERLAKKILHERNEQAVLLSRMWAPSCALETELVVKEKKQIDYGDFAKAFERAAVHLSQSRPERIDLAWQQLHLLQLVYRDLMASALNPKESIEKRKEVFRPLVGSLGRIVHGIFEGRILDRMSPSILATWTRIALELNRLGDGRAVPAVKPHVEQALKMSILEIADSLWRFQGHSFAGARDLDSDSCGVEAFAVVAGLNTWQYTLGLGLERLAEVHEEKLRKLWTDPTYIPHLLLRDWRGLSYCLNAPNRNKELAAAFGLRTVDAIFKSGISDERTWYRTMGEFFPPVGDDVGGVDLWQKGNAQLRRRRSSAKPGRPKKASR
jgi:hypothetical protein